MDVEDAHEVFGFLPRYIPAAGLGGSPVQNYLRKKKEPPIRDLIVIDSDCTPTLSNNMCILLVHTCILRPSFSAASLSLPS